MENTQQHQLDTRYVPYYFLARSWSHLLSLVVLILALYLILFAGNDAAFEQTPSVVSQLFSAGPILGALVLYFIGFYGWAVLVHRFYRYELRESEFRQEYGVLNKKYASVPYGRIQNVDVNRNLLERIFGLSELQIHTAGESTASSEGRLPGLAPETAEQLRDQLLDAARNQRDERGM
jgi:uncharacterized membrane protein YdbT with pleckstrin-like domain